MWGRCCFAKNASVEEMYRGSIEEIEEIYKIIQEMKDSLIFDIVIHRTSTAKTEPK